MRFVSFCILLLVLGNVSARSQAASAESDSTAVKPHERTYAMPEFVVSATRWNLDVRELPSSATVLTSSDLQNSNGISLANALDGVQGLFLKSYGGPGSVSTTSMRGMGAEHTLVLVDGQRFNNVRDGQVDFGVFLLQNIDRVEILGGGFSSVYGADAVGGIINIITRRPDHRLRLNGALSAGSYGMNGQLLGAEFSLGGIALHLGGRREAGLGNYKFRFDDGVSSSLLQRQNADYAINQFQLLADVPLSAATVLHVTGMYNRSERGSPGAVLSPSSGNAARLLDDGLLAQAVLDWVLEPTMSFRLSSEFNMQHRVYRDPLGAGGPDDQPSDYADRTMTVTPLFRYSAGKGTSMQMGAELSRSAIVSTATATAIREQQSIFVAAEQKFDLLPELLYEANLFPSVRYDHYTDIPGSVDPRMGINVGLWRGGGVRLKSSYGRSFRAPTFYDLYWKNGGNPDLRPERSLSFDAGLAFSAQLFGLLDLEASYFDIRTRDRIVWTPGKNGLWSPKNLLQVQSSGIELTGSWHLPNDLLSVRATYSNADVQNIDGGSQDSQTTDKQLPYIPHETAGIQIAVRAGFMGVSIHHLYTGYRFTTETNDPRFVLPGYSRTDVNVSAQISAAPVQTEARLEISNLFNTGYELFPNFPMPLRTFALRLLINY